MRTKDAHDILPFPNLLLQCLVAGEEGLPLRVVDLMGHMVDEVNARFELLYALIGNETNEELLNRRR